MWDKVSSNSNVESIRKPASNPKAAKSFTPPSCPLALSPSPSPPSPPTHLLYLPPNCAGEAFFSSKTPAAFLPIIHECCPLRIMMDSNAAGNLIDLMLMSSSHSSGGSGCENDAAAAAAAASAAAAGEKKRRFSEAQVKSLEVMFEEQAKLEPRKKQQLAKELGLQPRQVAIWFQNKRARWKSKQLERAYAALSADYDALRSSFDSLLHQKNLLSMQVQRLAGMLETNNSQQEKKESGKQIDCTVTGGEADRTQILSLSSNKNCSDGTKRANPVSVGKEMEHHLHKNDSSEQKQFCFHSNGWPSDQLMNGGGCSQWCEFLSYE